MYYVQANKEEFAIDQQGKVTVNVCPVQDNEEPFYHSVYMRHAEGGKSLWIADFNFKPDAEGFAEAANNKALYNKLTDKK